MCDNRQEQSIPFFTRHYGGGTMSRKATKPWHSGEALQSLVSPGRLSAEAAAPGMGVTSRTLYRWFKLRELPPRIVEQCATYFGVSPEWLETGRGEKYDSWNLGGHDAARRVEEIMLRYEAEMKRLFRNYTAHITKVMLES
jgi:hypothetical protein